MLVRIVIIALIFFGGMHLHAGSMNLYVENSGDEAIWAVIASHEWLGKGRGTKGYAAPVVSGWYKIEPGESVNLGTIYGFRDAISVGFSKRRGYVKYVPEKSQVEKPIENIHAIVGEAFDYKGFNHPEAIAAIPVSFTAKLGGYGGGTLNFTVPVTSNKSDNVKPFIYTENLPEHIETDNKEKAKPFSGLSSQQKDQVVKIMAKMTAEAKKYDRLRKLGEEMTSKQRIKLESSENSVFIFSKDYLYILEILKHQQDSATINYLIDRIENDVEEFESNVNAMEKLIGPRGGAALALAKSLGIEDGEVLKSAMEADAARNKAAGALQKAQAALDAEREAEKALEDAERGERAKQRSVRLVEMCSEIGLDYKDIEEIYKKKNQNRRRPTPIFLTTNTNGSKLFYMVAYSKEYEDLLIFKSDIVKANSMAHAIFASTGSATTAISRLKEEFEFYRFAMENYPIAYTSVLAPMIHASRDAIDVGSMIRADETFSSHPKAAVSNARFFVTDENINLNGDWAKLPLKKESISSLIDEKSVGFPNCKWPVFGITAVLGEGMSISRISLIYGDQYLRNNTYVGGVKLTNSFSIEDAEAYFKAVEVEGEDIGDIIYTQSHNDLLGGSRLMLVFDADTRILKLVEIDVLRISDGSNPDDSRLDLSVQAKTPVAPNKNLEKISDRFPLSFEDALSYLGCENMGISEDIQKNLIEGYTQKIPMQIAQSRGLTRDTIIERCEREYANFETISEKAPVVYNIHLLDNGGDEAFVYVRPDNANDGFFLLVDGHLIDDIRENSFSKDLALKHYRKYKKQPEYGYARVYAPLIQLMTTYGSVDSWNTGNLRFLVASE